MDDTNRHASVSPQLQTNPRRHVRRASGGFLEDPSEGRAMHGAPGAESASRRRCLPCKARESRLQAVFGSAKQQQAIEDLDARLKAIEGNVNRLVEERTRQLQSTIEAHLGAIRREVEADPDVRLRVLLDAASADVRRAVETVMTDARSVSAARAEVDAALAQVRDLDARLSGAGLGPPRKMAVGEVHGAEATGYVMVWFTTGTAGMVELRQGASNPPEILVSRHDCARGSFAGMVVRKGWYWQAWTSGDLECSFTPFL